MILKLSVSILRQIRLAIFFGKIEKSPTKEKVVIINTASDEMAKGEVVKYKRLRRVPKHFSSRTISTHSFN
jgi:Ni,Fe-hydrogenase maturation factor